MSEAVQLPPHSDGAITIPTTAMSKQDEQGQFLLFDPIEPQEQQYPSFKKSRQRTDIMTIPRATLNLKQQQPPQPTPAAKLIQQTPFTNNLGFLSSTGTFFDPDSGHRHPTYLHSSGMHGHHFTHNRKPVIDPPKEMLENQMEKLSISPTPSKKVEVLSEMPDLDLGEGHRGLPNQRARPSTAPAHTGRLATRSNFSEEFHDNLPHHVNLRPRSENPMNMRPKSANVQKSSYGYTGPTSHYKLLNPFMNEVAAGSRLDSSPETYYLLRATQQPTAPVAPTIVKTQTVRYNLDNFEIEKVALRRLRFVVENNESDVEHLSLVDLIESGQVSAPIIGSFFGPEFATPHDLRVLLLQSIDKSRRIKKRREGRRSPSPIHPPPEHPIHNQPPPNKGLPATFHHTHPHHISPATPIDSYSNYTAQSYVPPALRSATTPAEILTRDPHQTPLGDGVPRQLEDKHEVQSLLMLTHTTSEAAANIVVDTEIKIAACLSTHNSSASSFLGKKSTATTRSGSARSKRSGASTTTEDVKRSATPLLAAALLSGRATPVPVPATCMPLRAMTPTAQVIASDATKTAVQNIYATRRVTTPNEVLDILRQAEGPKTVLKGVIGEGWKRPGSSERRRRDKDGHVVDLEDIVLRNMDLKKPSSERSSKSRGSGGLKSVLSRDKSSRLSNGSKKSVRLAEEPMGGEPDYPFGVSLDFLPPPKNNVNGAVMEKHMLRIIERRRARYLVAGNV